MIALSLCRCCGEEDGVDETAIKLLELSISIPNGSRENENLMSATDSSCESAVAASLTVSCAVLAVAMIS
jgi:hypothetical protein